MELNQTTFDANGTSETKKQQLDFVLVYKKSDETSPYLLEGKFFVIKVYIFHASKKVGTFLNPCHNFTCNSLNF